MQHSLRCRTTLRGHADAVNSIQFLSYSNTLVTCSADKTISLWDARTGLCAQTFYGHMHSVNHASFNMQVCVLNCLKRTNFGEFGRVTARQNEKSNSSPK